MTRFFVGHNGPVFAAVMDKSQKYILSGGQDQTINIYNIKDTTPFASFTGHCWPVMSLSVSPNNQSFISSGGDHDALLWDICSQKITHRFSGHSQCINMVKHFDDIVIATASNDTTVRLWDPRTWRSIMKLDHSTDNVTAIDHHQTMITTSSCDGIVRTYDIRKGCMYMDNLHAPATFVIDLQTSFLVSTLNSTIHQVEYESGTILTEFQGHKNTHLRIPFAQLDNRPVMTSEESGNIYYRPSKQDPSLTKCLAIHNAQILSITIEHDQHLLTTASDGTIGITPISAITI